MCDAIYEAFTLFPSMIISSNTCIDFVVLLIMLIKSLKYDKFCFINIVFMNIIKKLSLLIDSYTLHFNAVNWIILAL